MSREYKHSRLILGDYSPNYVKISTSLVRSSLNFVLLVVTQISHILAILHRNRISHLWANPVAVCIIGITLFRRLQGAGPDC